jgi:hypothetical protein
MLKNQRRAPTQTRPALPTLLTADYLSRNRNGQSPANWVNKQSVGQVSQVLIGQNPHRRNGLQGPVVEHAQVQTVESATFLTRAAAHDTGW